MLLGSEDMVKRIRVKAGSVAALAGTGTEV
jgi:hypothetical protein